MSPHVPKSRFSSFAEERLPGIGHNQGPALDANTGFRRIAWKKARAQLMPRLPLEVLKRRVRRAKQLGLEYPAYASILLGTGRDIVGFLFTCDGLGMRLSRSLPLPDPIAGKLRQIERVDAMLAAEQDRPESLQDLLAAEMPIRFAGATRLPRSDASLGEGHQAIRTALDPLKLPGDAVVMIGTETHERDWADAAKLARFIPAESYFPALS
ncbi:MAG: hypothetical protein AAF479_04235 [Pseudomonadota bacterium]